MLFTFLFGLTDCLIQSLPRLLHLRVGLVDFSPDLPGQGCFIHRHAIDCCAEQQAFRQRSSRYLFHQGIQQYLV